MSPVDEARARRRREARAAVLAAAQAAFKALPPPRRRARRSWLATTRGKNGLAALPAMPVSEVGGAR